MSEMLYYTSAKKWKEALPLGNGRLAAMVYGDVKKERIALNDATLWSGYPRDYTNKKSVLALDKVRNLIFQEKYGEAEAIVRKNMSGEYSQSYLPLGEIKIKTDSSESKNYKRILDLSSAVLTIDNGNDKRIAFVSHADNAMYYKITNTAPINLQITVDSKLKSYKQTIDNSIILSGRAPDNVTPNYVIGELKPIKYNEGKGMAFAMRCGIETNGKIVYNKGKAVIKNATEVLLKITTETGFIAYNISPDTDRKRCVDKLLKNTAVNYNKAMEEHLCDYKKLFFRQELDINANDNDVLELLRKARQGKIDNSLVKLLYDYGKYLVISGSRGSQPLNLQGQWNDIIRPPWSSNLTTNINFQMNYWGVSECNLGECLIPFYNALYEIAESGEKTASINYGAKGFACNHNVDIWRMTTPVKGNPSYMYAPLCGAWIANEAYGHEKNIKGYVSDKLIAVIDKSIEFILDYLTEYKGEMVSCPSASPEAEFMEGRARHSLDYGTAFEMGIIKQAMLNCMESSHNDDLKKRCADIFGKLYDFRDTNTGINEWHNEKIIAEKGHRHFSPLYAFYPAKVIGYYDAGKRDMVRKLFDYRMKYAGNSIGWSAAWAICISARLRDSVSAYKIIGNYMVKSTLPNLMSYHPPYYFQIDGNLGFLAGINEMLITEEKGIIDLLPACPEEWKDGSLKGQKINGSEINFEWQNGKVTSIVSDNSIKVYRENIADNVTLKNVELVYR